MRWPFVSREQLADAVSVRETRIGELVAQVRDLTAERKLLVDFIAMRSNNASIYGSAKPIEIEEDDEPDAKEEFKVEDLKPTRARQVAQARERTNLTSFRAEEDEAAKAIADAIAAGKEAAEKAAFAERR